MKNYILTDEEIMQEVSDKEWMKGILLKAVDLASLQDLDGSKKYLDMLLGMLGLSFHNDVVRFLKAKNTGKKELEAQIVKLMLERIDVAFRSFQDFSDEKYPKYLTGKLILAQNNLNSANPMMENVVIVEEVGKRLETMIFSVKVAR